MSALSFDRVCQLQGLPVPVAEYCFARPRLWRLDWAWPDQLLALEVNGGIWESKKRPRGRHSRGVGQLNDMAKWSEAAARGWRIIHCVPADLESQRVMEAIVRALTGASCGITKVMEARRR